MEIGCYVCSSGYVSRIVTYGKKLDLAAFKALVSSLTKGVADVDDEDIRVGTRYTWDLGIKGNESGMVLREAYWTQSYRRTKNDNPNRVALFLCGKCDSASWSVSVPDAARGNGTTKVISPSTQVRALFTPGVMPTSVIAKAITPREAPGSSPPAKRRGAPESVAPPASPGTYGLTNKSIF